MLPFLWVQYNFDSGIYMAGRYRYDYARKTANYKFDDEKTNRFDTYIGYVFDELKLEYNLPGWMIKFKFDKQKKTNYEHNVVSALKLNKSFTPHTLRSEM